MNKCHVIYRENNVIGSNTFLIPFKFNYKLGNFDFFLCSSEVIKTKQPTTIIHHFRVYLIVLVVKFLLLLLSINTQRKTEYFIYGSLRYNRLRMCDTFLRYGRKIYRYNYLKREIHSAEHLVDSY